MLSKPLKWDKCRIMETWNWSKLNDSDKKIIINKREIIFEEIKNIIILSKVFYINIDERESRKNGYFFDNGKILIVWHQQDGLASFRIKLKVTKTFETEKKTFFGQKKIMENKIVYYAIYPFDLSETSNNVVTVLNFVDIFNANIIEVFKFTENERKFLNDLYYLLVEIIEKLITQEFEKAEQLKKEKEQLIVNKKNVIQKLDTDNNGEIDLIDNDFPKLLSKYQKQIIGIDKNYIHQFVKISNYISTKRKNIQQIFKSIDKINSKTDLEKRVKLLQNQVHTYDLFIFHSLNMIEALVTEDLITFYEIYEKFDKLGIYNSNWENEVSNKLTSIGSKLSNLGNKLDVLLNSIAKMEENIVSEIGSMNYSIQESFGDLNDSLTTSLKSINSSIDINNLFTAINTYQLYKINKQTKSLLPKN